MSDGDDDNENFDIEFDGDSHKKPEGGEGAIVSPTTRRLHEAANALVNSAGETAL